MPDPPVTRSPDTSQCLISDIKARLGKRATFELAAVELTKILLRNVVQQQLIEGDSRPAVADKETWDAVSRCATLLRTRYTAPAFWSTGRFLFQAASAAALTAEHRSLAADYLSTCEEHLAEQNAAADAAATGDGGRASARPTFLFEGQFSEERNIPPSSSMGHQQLMNLLLGTTQLEEANMDANAVDFAGNGAAGPEMNLAPLLQYYRDAFGDDADEMEAVLQLSLDAEGNNVQRAPPASQSAVQGLKVEDLTAGRLADLGGDQSSCSVCREALAVGSTVQVMPCSNGHVFHVPCLAPWLQSNNSCPVCRHELPTDDDKYERNKVLNADVAEANRGASAALSHNEFMYS